MKTLSREHGSGLFEVSQVPVTTDDGSFFQKGDNRAMTSQRASLTVALMTFGMVLSGAAAPAATGPAHLLTDINPTPSSNRGSFPESYGRLGKIALFHARTPQTGMELWRTDGTEAGTFLVKDTIPGPLSAFNYPLGDFTELNGNLLFTADDGVPGSGLWRSDGTEAGTVQITAATPWPFQTFPAPLPKL